jgi:hypothetical protein
VRAHVVPKAIGSQRVQQKDNLCGPFWAARVLTEAGFTEWDGERIDEDLIALRAGSVLPESNGVPSVPPGAVSRTRYRYQLQLAPADASGTAERPLMQAIVSASGGSLSCTPIRGPWTAELVERLVGDAPSIGARLIANLRTGRLWGSRPPIELVLDELAGRLVQGPVADWDVGHFVELAMLIRGPQKSLVLVHDSYPSLGVNGFHLQPPRVLAAALQRGDGREGGVLVIVPQSRTRAAVAHVAEFGLEIGDWNNGTRS